MTTSTRPEHRTEPRVLPDSELLPSQRALLAIEQSGDYPEAPRSYFSAQALNGLGRILSDEVFPMFEEERIAMELPMWFKRTSLSVICF